MEFFQKEGYQPKPVAVSESKRGTSDALFGYYTMGKLAILKLRADYQQKLGPAFKLQDFHDRFIAMGPLPLPLVREAMLGERGELFLWSPAVPPPQIHHLAARLPGSPDRPFFASPEADAHR